MTPEDVQISEGTWKRNSLAILRLVPLYRVYYVAGVLFVSTR